MQSQWTFTALTLVATGLLFPRQAAADDSSVVINDSFFDGVPLAPATEVLMVSVDSKALTHGDADAELIQYSKPESERRPDSCGLDQSPPVAFTLDCGVKMLGLETNGDTAVYYFLLKTRKGDWYQIILSPQSGATTWVKDPHVSGLSLTTYPFIDWLQSQSSYTTAHDMTDLIRAVPVLNKPEDTSDDLTDCAGYEDGEGLILTADKARNGDWVHVICLENGCYAANDPERTCIPQLIPQGVPCVQGWARWRTKDGRLILYPHDAFAQACS
jgi:hypothetical protein